MLDYYGALLISLGCRGHQTHVPPRIPPQALARVRRREILAALVTPPFPPRPPVSFFFFFSAFSHVLLSSLIDVIRLQRTPKKILAQDPRRLTLVDFFQT